MSETQVTYWRDLPSMVAARDDSGPAKAQLASRFQEAIDEAAMRLGDTGADDYLAGWRRGEWEPADAGAADALAQRVTALETEWPDERVAAYLDELGPA